MKHTLPKSLQPSGYEHFENERVLIVGDDFAIEGTFTSKIDNLICLKDPVWNRRIRPNHPNMQIDNCVIAINANKISYIALHIKPDESLVETIEKTEDTQLSGLPFAVEKIRNQHIEGIDDIELMLSSGNSYKIKNIAGSDVDAIKRLIFDFSIKVSSVAWHLNEENIKDVNKKEGFKVFIEDDNVNVIYELTLSILPRE